MTCSSSPAGETDDLACEPRREARTIAGWLLVGAQSHLSHAMCDH